MKTKLLKNLLLIILPFLLTNCISISNTTKKIATLQNLCNQRFNIDRAPRQQFYDLTTGLQVKVISTQPKQSNDKYLYSMSNAGIFHTPTINYVKSMGFKEMSSGQDYTLTITLNKVDVNCKDGHVDVVLGAKLVDAVGSVVYTQESMSSGNNLYNVPNGLNEQYTLALEQIDWVQIASFLKVERTAKNEPNKQVEGLGTTALEHTIIRWDIQSRPQGADIFWRVVSKTPDVKSTNNKYLTTTPYEATKALDIRGLTYQTSGNVRIILRCEKDGYMPQEKEYDVRMVLDQEEISAFFRLVKEE